MVKDSKKKRSGKERGEAGGTAPTTPSASTAARTPTRPTTDSAKKAKNTPKKLKKKEGKSPSHSSKKKSSQKNPTRTAGALAASASAADAASPSSSFSIFSHGGTSSSEVSTAPPEPEPDVPAAADPDADAAARDDDDDDAAEADDAGPAVVVERSKAEMVGELGEVLDGFSDKAQAAVDCIQASSAKLFDSDDFGTAEGVSLIEAKIHLMLNYNATLATLMARKLEGKSIEGHPMVDRLTYIRTVLEKLAPVEAKMKYQMDKYVRLATSAPVASGAADPLTFRPNLGDLAPKAAGVSRGADRDDSDGEAHTDPDGVYVPPRIAATPYAEEFSVAERKSRKKERDLQRMASSEMFQELRSEFSSAPTEVHHGDDIDNDVAAELRERDEIEESNFVRFGGRRKLEKKRARLATDLTKLADFDVTRGFSQADEDTVQLSMRDQMAAAKKRRVSGGSGRR